MLVKGAPVRHQTIVGTNTDQELDAMRCHYAKMREVLAIHNGMKLDKLERPFWEYPPQ